ncbi:hypothetical protein [Mesorhizobium denitrificans]|uniref:Uncharacterized protein n=1 Tax=Mesorhizobium denitrificans TaxID=2294114 RepID=A0A371XCY0_9HYPH|nr:hypothetical protein [Mesorhizobium denitrificans]RFC67081.1 hypothetical protein DY251_12985 [Mesorhizobium denitrificans]
MMEGEDEAEKATRAIPSLAHALEEARARAKLHYESAILADADEYEPVQDSLTAKHGSLLDFAQPGSNRPVELESKAQIARMAVEADIARRTLAGGTAKAAYDMQESMDEMRGALLECLEAVRECRELVRAMAIRRDRNYF